MAAGMQAEKESNSRNAIKSTQKPVHKTLLIGHLKVLQPVNTWLPMFYLIVFLEEIPVMFQRQNSTKVRLYNLSSIFHFPNDMGACGMCENVRCVREQECAACAGVCGACESVRYVREQECGQKLTGKWQKLPKLYSHCFGEFTQHQWRARVEWPVSKEMLGQYVMILVKQTNYYTK